VRGSKPEIGCSLFVYVDEAVFAEVPQYYDMFLQRLDLLKNITDIAGS
jgi:hypothetical protein